MIRTHATAADLSPLQARLGALFGLRLVLALAVLLAPLVAPRILRAQQREVLVVVAAYLLFALIGEVVRQWRSALPAYVVGAAILIDGVFIATVLTLGGGPSGPLSFLLYTHLVAVTLLASYRTGVKVAVWQSLLLVVAHYLPASVTGVPRLSVAAAGSAIVAFLAVALTTALCSALNERALRRSRSGFQALADMAGRLDDVHNPDEVVTVLLQAIPAAFDVRRVALLLREPATVTVLSGGALTTVPLDGVDEVVATCWEQRQPLLRKTLHAQADPFLSSILPGARNLIVLPYSADGESIGAVVVEYGHGLNATVTASAVTLLSQFTVHAALSYRNVKLMAEVKHLATVDGLTGLTNRRTFESTLQREVARALRTGEDLSLLLLDVDHFKQVNDQHGHPMGDEVLRHVGRVLSSRGREFDLPARYGGEEFVVILPGCAADEAIGVADRLRAGIAGDDAPLRVTASCGIAAIHRNAVDAEGLIKAADQALYDAKNSGRDRSVVARGPLHSVA